MSHQYGYNAQERMQTSTAASLNPRGEGSSPSQNTGDVSIGQRHGLLGWWLDLTAPSWPNQPVSIAERERLRKAELTSYSLLASFAFLIALVSNSLVDSTTARAVGLLAILLIIAAFLNRTGRTRLAAYFVPSSMMLILILAVVSAPAGLQLVGFPIYDLCVIPVVLSSLTADRQAPWLFSLVAIVFVILTFTFESHEIIEVAPGVRFDAIGYEQAIFGYWGLVNRHVALIFFAALFGWMGAKSVDTAIARADRAEEVAKLQLQLLEQKQQLEAGIQAIQQVQVRVANGDYGARVALPDEHKLWQVAFILNNMIQRLERASAAEQVIQRTKVDVDLLVQEIQRARTNQPPNWPPTSGGLLDPLIKEVARPTGF